jgi:ABC-type multidrug transport system ATPase subunit
LIKELAGKGKTFLVTTHYMDEAERLCARVAVVDHGKIIALGTPAELIASLGGDHVVEFDVTGGCRIAEEELAALPAVQEAFRKLMEAGSVERECGVKIAAANQAPGTLNRRRINPSRTTVRVWSSTLTTW